MILALLLGALFVLPATLGSDWIDSLTSVAIYAVVAAGLVVLYGKVGMISLGQIALLGVGTWVATRLNYLVDIPFPAAAARHWTDHLRARRARSGCRRCGSAASIWR